LLRPDDVGLIDIIVLLSDLQGYGGKVWKLLVAVVDQAKTVDGGAI
jgi:hypothetical protein